MKRMTKTELLSQDIVYYLDNKECTHSLFIAKYFEKRHENVIIDIEVYLENERKLKHNSPRDSHVAKSVYIDIYGREQKMYYVDEYYFNMVVLGYNNNCITNKIKFLDAFNYMKTQLKEQLKEQLSINNTQRLLIDTQNLNLTSLIKDRDEVRKYNNVLVIENHNLKQKIVKTTETNYILDWNINQ